MAELLGRETGVCAGRAGSMNVIDLEHRLVGCYGIVGGSIAAATGVALALKRRGGVAVAFFGDGATNQGYFHECLNFAKVHGLPGRLRLREQPLRRVHALRAGHGGRDPPSAPRTLGLPTVTIDGNDVWTVSATAAEAVERARERRRPAVRRVADLPLRRALAQRPGQVPQARRARRVEAARPAARRACRARRALWHERGGARRRRRRGRGEHGSRRRGREGRAVPGPRGAGDGFKPPPPVPAEGADRQEGGPRGPERDGLPHRDLPGARRGARARRVGHLLRRGRRRGRRRLRHHRRPGRASTAPTASSTPRSPSSPWPARPTAAPSAACARSSRSCSATSCR